MKTSLATVAVLLLLFGPLSGCSSEKLFGHSEKSAQPQVAKWGTIVSCGVILYSFNLMGGPYFMTVIVQTDEGEVLPVPLDYNNDTKEAAKKYKLIQGGRVKILIRYNMGNMGMIQAP